MKKLLVLALIVFAGYKFYHNVWPSGGGGAAFDKNGRPLVILFVGPGCGSFCERVENALDERKVAYETISVAGPDGAPVANKYGIKRFPTTLIGKTEILGDDLTVLRSGLAEAFGSEVLTRQERMAMRDHFDAQGHPKVVMYGTKWCPYCKQQREYFDANSIPYEEIDVEASPGNEILFKALGGEGFPLTYVGYRRFSGYQQGPLLDAFREISKTKFENLP